MEDELMMRLNVLNVLEQLIKESYFHCDWVIEWKEENQVIKLNFHMLLDNSQEDSFWDGDQLFSQNKDLHFVLSVLLHDLHDYQFTNSNHAIQISCDFNKGMEYGECYAIVKYLKILTSSTPIRWQDFLNSNQDESFSVEWDWKEYYEIRDQLINSQRYSHSLIYFP